MSTQNANNTENIVLRLATLEDTDNILSFLRDYWNPQHIFVKDKNFFRYIYNTQGNRLNFVIGIGEQSNIIYGVRGFIPSNQSSSPDIWGAIWKKAPYAPRGFGRRLVEYLVEIIHPRVMVGLSISDQGLAARKKLGETTGYLCHYYMLGNLNQFKIASIKNNIVTDYSREETYSLDVLRSYEELARKFPANRYKHIRYYKDLWYLKYRYYDYPYYKYNVFAINKHGIVDSILIGREIICNNSKIMRIVDFIGNDNDLSGIGSALHSIMNENNYEYIDFYEYGINDNIMKNMGFVLNKQDSVDIIPNYFEPFVLKNILLNYSTTDTHNLRVFKGDSDQDRPNLINLHS